MGKTVRDHLGFGHMSAKDIKSTWDTLFGDKFTYIGEHNSNNKLHGRGINIWHGVTIFIQYWDNGAVAPGNYLYIQSNGDVNVGKVYLKKGERWIKGTRYNTNGTTEEYDNNFWLIIK